MPAVMLATIAIYLSVVAVCLAVGVTIRAWLAPSGRWVEPSTLPLGLCGAIAVLYPLSVVMPTRVAVPALLGAVAVALAGALARRVGRPRAAGAAPGLASALWPTRADATLLGLGVLAGLVVLVPVLRLGFPTTLAIDINDAFNYSARAEGLHDARLVPSVDGIYGLASGVGLGFELLANVPMTLLAREPYEVVGASAAVAVPVAVAGWGCLLRELSGRLGTRAALVVPVAAVSPLFLTPFAHSQVTQLLSLALWPFAVAATLALARRATLPRLGAAALGVAGVVGVYPALLPWLVPALAVCLLARPESGGEKERLLEGDRPSSGERASRGGRIALVGARARYASGLGTVLALAVVVLAPIQSFRAVHYVTIIDGVRSWSTFPVLDLAAYGVSLAGAGSPFTFLSEPAVRWPVAAAAAAIGGVLLYAAIRLARMGGGGVRVHGVLGLTVAAVTGAALVRYLWLGEAGGYGYGAVKAVVSGGAILAGLAVIALARPGSAGPGWPRRLALGACLVVWLPASWQLMERSAGAEQGIRSQDVALAGALRDLPARSAVLVTSASDSRAGDKLRRSAEHFTTLYTDHELLNVGVYGSHRDPERAWSYVVSVSGPSPFGAGRVALWQDAHYGLAAAPALDAAPTGAGWLATGPAGGGVAGAVTSRAVVAVSNRTGAERRARLRLVVLAAAAPGRVELRAGTRSAQARLSPGDAVPIAILVDVPARGVARVELLSTPAAVAADAAPSPSGVRVLRASVAPAAGAGRAPPRVALQATP